MESNATDLPKPFGIPREKGQLIEPPRVDVRAAGANLLRFFDPSQKPVFVIPKKVKIGDFARMIEGEDKELAKEAVISLTAIAAGQLGDPWGARAELRKDLPLYQQLAEALDDGVRWYSRWSEEDPEKTDSILKKTIKSEGRFEGTMIDIEAYQRTITITEFALNQVKREIELEEKEQAQTSLVVQAAEGYLKDKRQ